MKNLIRKILGALTLLILISCGSKGEDANVKRLNEMKPPISIIALKLPETIKGASISIIVIDAKKHMEAFSTNDWVGNTFIKPDTKVGDTLVK